MYRAGAMEAEPDSVAGLITAQAVWLMFLGHVVLIYNMGLNPHLK